MTTRLSTALLRWALLAVPGIAFVGLTVLGPLRELRWEAPLAAFVIVVVLTVLCLAGAVAVLALGWRTSLAEVAILGSALATASILPLAHGLAMPGVLLADNTTVTVAAFAALPATLVVALPLMAPRSSVCRSVGRRWRGWSVTALVLSAAAAGALLAAPRALPAPSPGDPVAVVVASASLAGAVLLSLRQLRLYRIGGRGASLAASVGMLYLGLSMLVWLGAAPYSLAWWGAHAADGLGVLLAALGLALAHHRDGSVAPTLAPVVNRDPLIALELGLTPVVHRFVDSLRRKDAVTRDHVVRVGELAMRVGVRAGLGPERLRALGLAALLHDIGKLSIPDAVLAKPGPLDDDEFALMQTHTTEGHAMMLSSAVLAPAALLVRWHHERVDGTGYPDGLKGDRIPLEASLISVCDAYDAMTWSRPYRTGMAADVARRILREGAGSQWDTRSVDLLLAELDANGPVTTPRYDRVGEDATSRHPEDMAVHVCDDAVPVALTL